MQLFQVKDERGNLIMNAPLETIRWVFGMPTEMAAHILHTTRDLNTPCVLPASDYSKWKTLVIERLPLEIPSDRSETPSGKVVRLQREAKVTTETELGRLLCDE